MKKILRERKRSEKDWGRERGKVWYCGRRRAMRERDGVDISIDRELRLMDGSG